MLEAWYSIYKVNKQTEVALGKLIAWEPLSNVRRDQERKTTRFCTILPEYDKRKGNTIDVS